VWFHALEILLKRPCHCNHIDEALEFLIHISWSVGENDRMEKQGASDLALNPAVGKNNRRRNLSVMVLGISGETHNHELIENLSSYPGISL
jgi:hypothetical protein